MRPTVTEQLDGVSRLLDLAETAPGLPPDARDHVRNARRLLERVSSSWGGALPFLLADNAAVARLLGDDVAGLPAAADGLTEVAERNEQLRGRLAGRVRELPPGAERDAIGRHLRDRVAADPT